METKNIYLNNHKGAVRVVTGILYATFFMIIILLRPAPAQTEKVKNTAADKNTGTAVTEPKPTVKDTKTRTAADTTAKKAKPQEKKAPPTKEEIEKKEKEAQIEHDKKMQKWIRDTLAFGVHKDRKEAIVQILTIKDKGLKEELVNDLVELLKTEYDSDVKVKALTTMGEIKVQKGLPEITALLDDVSIDVRIAAVYTLKNLKADSTKGILSEKLKKEKMHTDSQLIEALIITLGEFNATELIPFARETIEKNDSAGTIRERFVLFLGNIKSAESKDFLLNLYKNEEEDVTLRAYAVNSLAKLGIKEVTPDIKTVLSTIDTYPMDKKKRYHSLAIYSVAALVKLGDNDATPRLINSLKSDSAGVRLKAIELLKELKDKRTIDILQYKMKHDPNNRVRKAAAEALKEMGVAVEESKTDKNSTDQPQNEEE